MNLGLVRRKRSSPASFHLIDYITIGRFQCKTFAPQTEFFSLLAV